MNTQIQTDKSWTLFLDRDGVINDEIIGSYITKWEEFSFSKGSLDALRMLGEMFGNIVVVTNQRGVGKGIMSLDDLKDIHSRMTKEVADEGGRLDIIYSCTALNDDDHNRKPNTGMAVQAQQDYPEIDFKRSVMIGNNLSDMEFGKRVGMYTVFLSTTQEPQALPHDLIDEQHPSLLDWANSLVSETVG